MLRLRWLPGVRASGLNAAWQMRRVGLPSGVVWPLAFAAEAATLDALAVETEPGNPEGCWVRLIAAADSTSDARALAERWLLPSDRMAAVGEDTLTAASSAIEAIAVATRDAFPQLEAQLKLRIGPIRDQWDGYGSGMIAHTRRLTGLEVQSPSFDILAALPVGVRGMASCCPASSSVVVEAVLTNPLPRLPEVVRLAWCVVNLLWCEQFERSKAASRSSKISTEPRWEPDVLAIALLPAILAAAEIVELSRCDEVTLGTALQNYTAPLTIEPPSAPKLLHWWETYLQTRPPWDIAIEALRRTLS